MIRPGFSYGFVLLSLGLAGSWLPLRGQENTLYFMHAVPQAIHTNPALYYRCRTYVEIPVLSSIRYSYGNSGLGYHDALHYGSGTNADSLIIDVDNLEKKLKRRNYLRNDFAVNIAGAGFRLMDRFYVHLNIANVTETRLGIPGDLVALKDGNWNLSANEPRDIDLSVLGLNAINYFQVAAGLATEVYEGLYAGITVKYLKGAANIRSRKTELVLETGGSPIRVQATTDYSIRTSFPMQISYDSQGYISSLDFSNSFADPVKDFILNKNNGAAIDLGVLYEYDDQLTLSASLIDLGFLHWGSNVQQLDASANVDFQGFDLRTYISSGGSTDFFQALLDSVTQSFQFENSVRPYFSTLVPKLYAGASYLLYPELKVSALARTEFFDRRPHFSLTLAGMYSPLPYLHGTLSYSIMNYKLNQLGFGLAVGGPGAQFYLVSDHIPLLWVKDAGSGAFWPYNARTLNFRLGVNLIFSCEDRDRDNYPRRPGSRGRRKYCPAYD